MLQSCMHDSTVLFSVDPVSGKPNVYGLCYGGAPVNDLLYLPCPALLCPALLCSALMTPGTIGARTAVEYYTMMETRASSTRSEGMYVGISTVSTSNANVTHF